MPDSITINGNQTGQQATGSPTLIFGEDNGTGAVFGDYLAWTGTDKKCNFINVEKSGGKFGGHALDPAMKSAYGPALVLTPDQRKAWYLYTNEHHQVTVHIMTRGGQPTPPSKQSFTWYLRGASFGNPTIFFDVHAAGGPAAHLGTQNGSLCLNVSLVERDTNTVCLGQVYLDDGSGRIAFSKTLKVKNRFGSEGACLTRDGHRYLLAYFDKSDSKLRLAHSADTFFEFDAARDCILDDLRSEHSPSIIRLGNGLLLVVFTETTSNKVAFAIAGRAASGAFRPYRIGYIDGAIANSAPTARLRWSFKDGVVTEGVVIAWTQNDDKKNVYYSELPLEMNAIHM